MDGECPNCGAKVPVKPSVKLGYITYCPKCDAELEIVNLTPVELDYPFEDYVEDDEYEFEEDDFDDDDEEDDDDDWDD